MAERTRFFNLMAATDRAKHPSGSSDRQYSSCLSPWRSAPPQKNFGTAMRPRGDATFRAAGNSAPIHGWLTLQAIRFNCTSGTAGTASHSTFRAAAPVTTRGLPAAVESFTRSSASCQMVCAPSEYGSMRVRACALAPCARESGSSWLSCARRSAWLRCRNAGRSSQPQ